MNERFKFRVWDSRNQRYVDEFADAYNRIWRYYIDQNGDLIGVDEDNVDRIQDDNFTIEQCTGLKDISGNFIFENDVVRVNTYCDAQPEYKVILWKECYSGYLLTSCDLDGSYNFYYGGLEFSEKEAKEYVSIVGNVHTWQDKK